MGKHDVFALVPLLRGERKNRGRQGCVYMFDEKYTPLHPLKRGTAQPSASYVI
jgi:hypothetical protein